MELLGHMITLLNLLKELPDCFPKQLSHLILPLAMCENSNFFPSLLILVIIDHSHLSGREAVYHCGRFRVRILEKPEKSH